jgi:hypothetical protein
VGRRIRKIMSGKGLRWREKMMVFDGFRYKWEHLWERCTDKTNQKTKSFPENCAEQY